MINIAIIVGSLRKESCSRKIANYISKLFPKNFEVEFIEIGNLPFYNPDYDEINDIPDEIILFRDKLKKTDAVLFITPEYNRSFPGVLKNAIDVGSRPVDENVWNNKPAAIINLSIGLLAQFNGSCQLRQTLEALNMCIMKQQEVYVSHAEKLIEENGNITDQKFLQSLRSDINKFVTWTVENKGVLH